MTAYIWELPRGMECVHIELACMPNRTNRALSHDLYAKSKTNRYLLKWTIVDKSVNQKSRKSREKPTGMFILQCNVS